MTENCNASELPQMNLQDFRDLGFLQECNRLFFHPRGLALSMSFDDTGKALGFGPVWDYRDDPEGLCFGNEDMATENAIRMAANVETEFQRHIEPRVKLFGATVQPIGE